jgi:hypothetical protein
MNEIWKDVPGYEGLYEISNFGNVMSLNYRGHGYRKQLTPKCNNAGRLWVELCKNGERKPWLIHRLVGMVFIPNPNEYPQINHKDENPKNNVVSNLEWCTREYNIQYYRDRHPERPPFRPSRNYRVRSNIPVIQLTKDGTVVRRWDNSCQVKKTMGWSDWSVAECCRGNRKTAYGFIWKYEH